MNLSVNQNRQFFAVKENDTSLSLPTDAWKGAFLAAGDGESVYFQMAAGSTTKDIQRSDLIPIKNILYVNARYPVADKIHTITITCPDFTNLADPTDSTSDVGLANGDPRVNQDYILSVTLHNFVSNGIMSPYVKHGVVHTVVGMKTTDFAAKLVASLQNSFARELPSNKFVTVAQGTSTNANKVILTVTSMSQMNGDIVGVSGVDKPIVSVSGNAINYEPWIITEDMDSVNKTVTETDTNAATYNDNVRMVKEIEHFCMGERGDQMRQYGYPMFANFKKPTDEVKPASGYGYCLLNVHYAYIGDNESVQKSEKTLTIAVPQGEYDGDSDSSTTSDFEAIVDQFETVTGLTVTPR